MVPGRGTPGCLQRARPPASPAPGPRVRGGRSAPSTPARSRRRGKPAPGRSSGRRAGPSAGAAPTRGAAQLGRSEPLQRRPLSGVERSCRPRRAHLDAGTCARTPAARGGRGGAAAGAGPRHLSASLRPRPLRLTCSQRRGRCTGPIVRGRDKPRNSWRFGCRRENWQIAERCRAGRVWELQWRQVRLRESWSGVVHSRASEPLADVGSWRPLN